MEFQLPENLAKKLIAYDEVLKATKVNKPVVTEEESKYLKRKAKLAFPCPDIFFDISLDTIHEIYEEFCSLAIPHRFRWVHDSPEQAPTYLVAWDNYAFDNGKRNQYWYCWKIGDIDCPVTLREWNTNMSCDEYEEACGSKSFKEFSTATNNPFYLRYKKERIRRQAVDGLIARIADIIEKGIDNARDISRVRRFTTFDLYTSSRFFYEKHCKCENKREFYATAWISQQELYSQTSRHNDIKTLSTIVNSKFYQSEVRKELEEVRKSVLKVKEDVSIDAIVHRLSYVYLFLFLFPNEYDRSIKLYQELKQFNLNSRACHWGVFSSVILTKGTQSYKFFDYLRERITPQMFMKWILEEAEIKQKRAYDTTIRDTVEMIGKVYKQTSYVSNPNPEWIKEPKRWRLLETHDHFSGIILQMDNNLKNLPTDLIPEPVEFDTEIGKVKLFQPATNHEVIRWGKAVRNCVGSAGYDDRVLKRQVFLVFAERNGRPWLTSMLTLRMGLLQVGQTVSPFNANLDPEEQKTYQDCLKEVLTAN